MKCKMIEIIIGKMLENMIQLHHCSQAPKENYSSDAKQNREEYLQVFNGKGKVEWQDDMLNIGRA